MSNNNSTKDNTSDSSLPLVFLFILAGMAFAVGAILTRPPELPRHEIVTTTDVNGFGQKIKVTENVTRNDDGSTYVIFTTN